MRLLIINPNTTEAMTQRFVAAARKALPAIDIIGATGRFGTRYIASRASYAVAGHAALDALSRQRSGADAIVLACFGDPGLDALREVSNVPVISLIEASLAASAPKRFAIVTGGNRWEAMLGEILTARHLAERFVGVRTLKPSGGTIAADPDAAFKDLTACCEAAIVEDHAQTIILGGVGLLGLAERLQPHFDIPILCSNLAGISAANDVLTNPKAIVRHETEISASIGLSPELEALFLNGKLG